jgi:hypothetical protein
MEEYLNFVKVTTEEWIEKGECQAAIKLNETIGEVYFDTGNPHFFTGDLKAKLVMVQLNPKREKRDFFLKSKKSFEYYLEFYSYYGKYVYGIESKRNFKSKFDQKLIRFLKPLNLIDLNSTDVFQNLENVVDQKLQLELIPFGSPNFDYNKIPNSELDQYIDQILSLITSVKRSCIIFGGRVFSKILSPFIVNKEIHRFKLLKVNGELTKNEYEIEKLSLSFEGKPFNAIIAPHFAIQGMPVEQYGKKLNELLNQ